MTEFRMESRFHTSDRNATHYLSAGSGLLRCHQSGDTLDRCRFSTGVLSNTTAGATPPRAKRFALGITRR